MRLKRKNTAMRNFEIIYKRAEEAVRECCTSAKRKIQVEANAFMGAANVLGIPRTFARAGQCHLYMGECDAASLQRMVVFSTPVRTALDGEVIVVCMRYVRKGHYGHRACFHVFVVTPHEWANRDALAELKEWP